MLPFLTSSAVLASRIVEVTLANSTEVSISALFSAGDWAGANLKRVKIPAGVTIGSTHAATAALRCGTGRGGRLEIVLDGNVDGAGGAAHSGTGGDAISIPQSGVTLKGAGNLRAGGGGGGDGGLGGAGVFFTDRTVTEGEYYAPVDPTYYAVDTTGGGTGWVLRWASANLNHPTVPYAPGDGYTYYAGTSQGNALGAPTYSIYRTHVVTDVPNATAGGSGGAGNRGQGSDGAAVAGSAGSAGGTNAGTGGNGGTGGAFGNSGSAGSTGANGNNGSGVAGTAGGLSGYAVNGNANVDRTAFSGSVLGRIV